MGARSAPCSFKTSLFPESFMELVVFWAESLYLQECVCFFIRSELTISE